MAIGRDRRTAVLVPNLGLYLDRPAIAIPPRGLQSIKNLRLKNGRIERENLGWNRFFDVPLQGAVTLIDNFFQRDGGQFLLFGTTLDLYLYDESAKDVDFLTPRYETGTVSINQGSSTVTGVGTTWLTNLKAGDYINFGATGFTLPSWPNLLAHSEAFDEADAWETVRTTVTADTTAAPDGTTTADTIAENTETGNHGIKQDILPNLEDDTDYTFSAWAKQNGRRYLNMSLPLKGAGWAEAIFDLQDGVVQFTDGNTISASIEAAANGFYRCTMKANIGSGATGGREFGLNLLDGPTLGDASYTGDGSSGFFYWGAQVIKSSDDAKNAYRSTTTPWYKIDSVDNNTQLTLEKTFREANVSGVAYTARKVFTGDLFDYWRTETFPNAQPSGDDLWYATNGVDDVVRWDGVDDEITLLTSLGLKCKELIRWNNMMIYGNIQVSGNQRPLSQRNSAIGEPENVSTLEAAENIISDGVDQIVGYYPLGDSLVAYTERSIVLIQFVDVPILFVFRTSIDGLGPLSGRAVADFGDFHEFIGPDAQYRFDGISVTEIGSHVWREILRQQSPNRLNAIVSHFDEENGDLIWGIPLSTDTDPENGGIDTAYVEHYLETVEPEEPTPFSFRQWPATCSGFFSRESTLRFSDLLQAWSSYNFRWNDRFFQSAFPFNLFGTQSGFIYNMGEADDFDGQGFESFARTPRRPAWDGDFKGAIKRIYPFAGLRQSGSFSLQVRVYGSDREAGAASLLSDLPYDLTHQGERFVTPRAIARYVEFEWYTSGANQPWDLEGYDFDRKRAGRR